MRIKMHTVTRRNSPFTSSDLVGIYYCCDKNVIGPFSDIFQQKRSSRPSSILPAKVPDRSIHESKGRYRGVSKQLRHRHDSSQWRTLSLRGTKRLNQTIVHILSMSLYWSVCRCSLMSSVAIVHWYVSPQTDNVLACNKMMEQIKSVRDDVRP